ncbi:LOW QUALITY PROTEIN: survival motor neuron protein 1-like [Chlamydotis macqueenii]
MAESTLGSRGPDRAGSRTGLCSPRPSLPPWEAAGEGWDGSSETPTSGVTLSEEEEEEGHRWRVGDAPSIAWAGDGLLYPAWLQALDPATRTCLVQFDGYGNTEERALANLLLPCPTAWGATNLRGKGLPSSRELPPGPKRRKGEQAPCSSWSPEVMPPARLCAIQEEEEALAAMLMAWYTSGYHTGFYIGLREGQPEAAESPSKALLQVEAALVQLGGQLDPCPPCRAGGAAVGSTALPLSPRFMMGLPWPGGLSALPTLRRQAGRTRTCRIAAVFA